MCIYRSCETLALITLHLKLLGPSRRPCICTVENHSEESVENSCTALDLVWLAGTPSLVNTVIPCCMGLGSYGMYQVDVGFGRFALQFVLYYVKHPGNSSP